MDANKRFKYMRIQGRELSANTNYAKGIFSMVWSLINENVMDEEDVDLYREIDAWFAENLPYPEPCMNRERVVCFFKTENSKEMINLITPAMWLLERYNHPFYVVYTNFPGEIVYEDKYQVAVKIDDTVIVDDSVYVPKMPEDYGIEK